MKRNVLCCSTSLPSAKDKDTDGRRTEETTRLPFLFSLSPLYFKCLGEE
jgi:hypothetical protein